jgi:TRAP transporter TAXI family solute receptor
MSDTSERFRSVRLRRLLVGAAAVSMLAACQPLEGGEEGAGATADASDGGGGGANQLTIATGGTGGVYYPLGGGFATVIRENVSGYDASVQETNASVDNMLLIGEGQADLALVLGDTAADALAGEADFEDPVDACALGNLYDNYTQLVTSSDSGIANVKDLAGKSVSLGAPGSGTEIIALRILEAAGIDPDADIERQQLGVEETAAALRDNTIDAGFWSGGLPTGALVDYATTGEMVLVPTADHTDALVETFGNFYFAEDIPADTYEGQTEAVPTIVVPNVLVASPDMPEDLQRQITAAIFDNREQLIEVHPAAEEMDPATAGDIDFMEVCPGAQAYFDEQG